VGAGRRAQAVSRPTWHWLLLLGQVAMWGSAFLLIKLAVAGMGPATVVALRLLIATVVLLTIVLASGRRLPLTRAHLGYFAAIAVTGNCLPFWLIAWSEQWVGAGLAGILMAIMPLSTLALAHLFVEGERTNPVQVVGFALGFAGIVVLVGPDAVAEVRGTGSSVFWAEAALLGAAICYAASTVLARKRPPAEPLVAAAGIMLAGALIMAPVAWFTEAPGAIDPTGTPAVAVLVLGTVCTALAGVTFLRIVDVAGPTFLSLINYLIPVWALLGSMVFLHERAEPRALVALGLILAGIGLAETLGRRAR